MRLILFILAAAIAFGQPNSTNINVIPKPDDTPGTLKFWGQKINVPGFSVALTAPAGLTADYTMTLPDTPADGFLLYDSMTGLMTFSAGGTGCVGCMDLTTAQTATGIKTMQNGIILQGTSTVRTFNPEADLTYDQGTSSLRFANIWGGNFKSKNGELIILNSGGTIDRSVVGVNGFIGYEATGVTAVNTMFGSGAGFQGINTTLAYGVAGNTVIDSAAAATFTNLTVNTGAAVVGYCWVATSTGGSGDWAACSAGGSFVTTNTAQTGLTGTKEWNSNHTYNAHILTGTANTYDFGTNALPFRVNYTQTVSTEFLEITDSGRAAFWRLQYGGGANQLVLYSGSGAQAELGITVASSTATSWAIRGYLIPMSVTGSNGDIGTTGTPWRSAYFSNNVNATTSVITPLLTGQFVELSSSGAGVTIDAGRMSLGNTAFQGRDSTITVTKVLLSWGGVGAGIIRTFDNSGNFHNSMDSGGVQTNVGFAVGAFGSPTTVIDNVGNAVFPTIRITSAPSAGYILTSDASGNGTWQAPSGGSFITTNTGQTGLSGAKSTSGLWTFTGGVAVQLSSTARDWLPEAADVYSLGDNTNRWFALYSLNVILSGGRSNWTSTAFNGMDSGLLYSKVLLSWGGSGAGIIRSFDNSGTFQNGFDSTGVLTSIGYSVGAFGAGTTVIDSSRAGYLTGLTLSTGATTGYCWTAQNGAGLGAWQACGGGSNITTNTAQTGLTGDKQINASNTWTWGTSGAGRFDMVSSTLRHYNSANGLRVLVTNTGASSGSVGSVLSYTGSSGAETIWAGFNGSGYWANGSAGISSTLTVRNSAGTGTCTITVSLGIIVATTC